jgi:hypothetical protein
MVVIAGLLIGRLPVRSACPTSGMIKCPSRASYFDVDQRFEASFHKRRSLPFLEILRMDLRICSAVLLKHRASGMGPAPPDFQQVTA